MQNHGWGDRGQPCRTALRSMHWSTIHPVPDLKCLSVLFLPSSASDHKMWKSPGPLLPSSCGFTGTWMRFPSGGITASWLPGLSLQTTSLCHHPNPEIPHAKPHLLSWTSGILRWIRILNAEMDQNQNRSQSLSRTQLPPFCPWPKHASG